MNNEKRTQELLFNSTDGEPMDRGPEGGGLNLGDAEPAYNEDLASTAYKAEAGTETHQVSEADIWKQVGNVLDPEEDGFHEAVAALEAQFGKEHVSIQPTTVDGRTQCIVLISPEAQKTQAEEVRKAGL